MKFSLRAGLLILRGSGALSGSKAACAWRWPPEHF